MGSCCLKSGNGLDNKALGDTKIGRKSIQATTSPYNPSNIDP